MLGNLPGPGQANCRANPEMLLNQIPF